MATRGPNARRNRASVEPAPLRDAARRRSDPPTFQTWATILGIPPSDVEEAMRAFFELRKLRALTERALRALQLKHDLHHRWQGPVQEMFHIEAFFSATSIQRALLTEAVLLSLSFAAEELARHPEERAVPPEDLAELREFVNRAIAVVSKGSLPLDLLVDRLYEIESAIHHYQIRGIVSLQRAAEQTIGSIVLNKELIRPYTETEELEAVSNVWTRTVQIISVAAGLTQIADGMA